MNEIWTGKAQDKYDSTIHQLLQDWPVRIAQQFIDAINDVIEQIKRYPNMFKASEGAPYLRQAKVNDQVSLIYQVDNNDLILIDILIHRQNG